MVTTSSVFWREGGSLPFTSCPVGTTGKGIPIQSNQVLSNLNYIVIGRSKGDCARGSALSLAQGTMTQLQEGLRETSGAHPHQVRFHPKLWRHGQARFDRWGRYVSEECGAYRVRCNGGANRAVVGYT